MTLKFNIHLARERFVLQAVISMESPRLRPLKLITFHYWPTYTVVSTYVSRWGRVRHVCSRLKLVIQINDFKIALSTLFKLVTLLSEMGRAFQKIVFFKLTFFS